MGKPPEKESWEEIDPWRSGDDLPNSVHRVVAGMIVLVTVVFIGLWIAAFLG